MAWFATRAHGNVTRAELLGAGVSPRMIDRRIEKGALISQDEGVYRVGHTARLARRPPAGHALGLVKGKVPEPQREDTMRWKNIPVTSPPRTLVDLAAELSAEALARACHEARVRYGTKPRHVDPASKGSPCPSSSACFLQRLREAGLPLPQTNVVAGTKRCRLPLA